MRAYSLVLHRATRLRARNPIDLADALKRLGVARSQVLMVHVRLSSLVWVVGGIDTVVHALRDSVGSDGTLMAFCGWDE